MLQSEDTLTIIVPVYDEEESLSAFRDAMNLFLDKSSVNVTVLFVNDGSKDKSQQIIESICSEDKCYSYLTLAVNSGLSAAIKAGFDFCSSDYVGYIDSDIQTSPEDFLKYFEFFPEYTMVNGIRQNRKDTFVKKMSSKIANGFRDFMINDNIQDTCCPLKIMKTDAAKKMPFFKGMHRFMPALIQLQGGNVKQVPVRHFERYAGTAKYHLFNRLVGPFMDTLAFRWMRSRNIRYTIAKHS